MWHRVPGLPSPSGIWLLLGVLAQVSGSLQALPFPTDAGESHPPVPLAPLQQGLCQAFWLCAPLMEHGEFKQQTQSILRLGSSGTGAEFLNSANTICVWLLSRRGCDRKSNAANKVHAWGLRQAEEEV